MKVKAVVLTVLLMAIPFASTPVAQDNSIYLIKHTYELDKGWNMIGWILEDRVLDNSIFEEIPPLVCIYGYKEGEGLAGWTYRIKDWQGNTLEKLIQSRGYWMMLSEDFIWEADCGDMEARLLSHEIADNWWNIPDTYREDLAYDIIQEWSFPIRAFAIDRGDTPPELAPWDYESSSKYLCQCMCEAELRYFILGEHEGAPENFWWYDQLSDEWRCVNPGFSFGLPIYLGAVDKVGWGGHWILAIQIDESISDWDSWIFFQYDEIVRPGNPAQMPVGSNVRVFEIEGVTITSKQYWLNFHEVANFENVDYY